MSTNMIYGLGLYFSDFEIREDALERLYAAVPDKKAKKIERAWLKNSPNIPLEKYLEVSLRVTPLEKVMADLINESVFHGQNVVRGVAGALYVPVSLPRTVQEKYRMPLESEVKEAIAGYAKICFKGVFKRDVCYQMFLSDK